MKAGITIRMGAGKWTVTARTADGHEHIYDMNRMNRREQHAFRTELVRQFRVANEARGTLRAAA
jgi:hypothetical protein